MTELDYFVGETGSVVLLSHLLSSSLMALPADASPKELIWNHLRKMETEEKKIRMPEFDQPDARKDWFNGRVDGRQGLTFAEHLKGRLVVLDFWTYCCTNCLHILPALEAMEHKFENDPVTIVGVHSAKFENERNGENLKRAILRYNIRHPVINDPTMRMWKAMGVTCWPTILIVSPTGHLLFKCLGEKYMKILDGFVEHALSYYRAEEPSPLTSEPLHLVPENTVSLGVENIVKFPGKLEVDDESKRLFISDTGHNRILICTLDGAILQEIGDGMKGFQDGNGGEARFNAPQGLAYDSARTCLYIADTGNHAIRRYNLADGEVTTLAGTGAQGQDRKGGKVGREQILCTPWDLQLWRSFACTTPYPDVLMIAMAGLHQIWTLHLETLVTERYSGSGQEANRNAVDPEKAGWAQPSGLALDPQLNELFIADSESSTVRAIYLKKNASRTIVGGRNDDPTNLAAYGDVDAFSDGARLQHPMAVAWAPLISRIVVADAYNHKIKLVDPMYCIASSLVGLGLPGHVDNDGSNPKAVQFSEPSGLAILNGMHVLVADTNSHAIRSVNLATGATTTLELRYASEDEINAAFGEMNESGHRRAGGDDAHDDDPNCDGDVCYMPGTRPLRREESHTVEAAPETVSGSAAAPAEDSVPTAAVDGAAASAPTEGEETQATSTAPEDA